MPGRLRRNDLDLSMNSPEAAALLVGFLNIQIRRMRAVEQYRTPGHEWFGLLDLLICQYVFAFQDEGTRQASIIHALTAPRSSIRNSLRRLTEAGILFRDPRGIYYPARGMARIANDAWPGTLRDIGHLCKLFEDYRKATKGAS